MLTTLLSLTCLIPVVWVAYTVRSWVVARESWDQFSADTKAFYLLVAPPLTFALDLLVLTDRLFYWPRDGRRRTRGDTKRVTVRSLVAAAGMFLIADAAIAADTVGAEAVPSLSDLERTADEVTHDSRRPYLNASEASAIQYRDLPSDEQGGASAVDDEH